MKLKKKSLHYLIVIFVIFLSFTNCTKEDICTKQVNVPIWNENEQIFEDNFQDFPCSFNGITKSISEFTIDEKKNFIIRFKNKKTIEFLKHSLVN